jgi:hypothetical protein
VKKSQIVWSDNKIEPLDVSYELEKMMVEELTKSIDSEIINNIMGLDGFENNLDRIIKSIENEENL